MNIKIKSCFQFSEGIYDAAFGVAKSMILNEKKSAFKRRGDFTLTAKAKENSAVVTIHEHRLAET